jgi:hypothetical protein
MPGRLLHKRGGAYGVEVAFGRGRGKTCKMRHLFCHVAVRKMALQGSVPAPSHNEQIKKMKLQIRSLTSIMPEELFG